MRGSRVERGLNSQFQLGQIGVGGSWRPGGAPKYFQRPRSASALPGSDKKLLPFQEGPGSAVASSAELLAGSKGRRLSALLDVPLRRPPTDQHLITSDAIDEDFDEMLELQSGDVVPPKRLSLLEALHQHGPPSVAAGNRNYYDHNFGDASTVTAPQLTSSSSATALDRRDDSNIIGLDTTASTRRRSEGLQLTNASAKVSQYFQGEDDPSRSEAFVKGLLRTFDQEEVVKQAVHDRREKEWSSYKERNGYYMRPTTAASKLSRDTYEPRSASHHQFPLTSSDSLRPQMIELPQRQPKHAHPTQLQEVEEDVVLDDDDDDFVVDDSQNADSVLAVSQYQEEHQRNFADSFDSNAQSGSVAAVRPYAVSDGSNVLPGSTGSTAGMRGTERSLQSTNSSTIPLSARAPGSTVSPDVIDLVTEEFASMREKEILKRRRVLYELTHPIPTDYTYGGKLVPPPPLAFGKITEEAVAMGRQMMQGQTYSHVRTSPHSDYFFEINDLYMEIAMVGKANAGKSSLINGLLGQDVAKTSSTPNSTRGVNFYQAATPEELKSYMGRNPSRLVKLPAGGLQLTFVDLPGFGITGMSDKWRDNAVAVTDSYMGVRRSLNTVLMCIDATKGMTPTDERYFKWIENIHGLFYVVITKCDAVPHKRLCELMRKIYQTITDRGGGERREKSKKFNAVYPFIIPVSAHTGENMDLLRGMLVETSGLIQGHKLRKLLRRKSQEANRLAETDEVRRIEAARELEKQIGIEEYASRSEHSTASTHQQHQLSESSPTTNGRGGYHHAPHSHNKKGSSSSSGTNTSSSKVPSLKATPQYVVPSIVELNKAMMQKHLEKYPSKGRISDLGGDDDEAMPSGAMELLKRFNLGVKDIEGLVSFGGSEPEKPTAHKLDGEGAGAGGGAPPSTFIRKQGHVSSRVLGVTPTSDPDSPPKPPSSKAGPISAFLDAVDQYEEEKSQESHTYWSDESRRKVGAARMSAQHSRHALLVEQPDGVLKATRGTSMVAGALMSIERGSVVPLSPGSKRRAALLKEAALLNPSAPWSASGESVRQKLQHLKEHVKMTSNGEDGINSGGGRKSNVRIKMSKNELASYLRTSGKTIQEFEKFESEVTMKSHRNDLRKIPTAYAKGEARLNDSTRISFSHMPVGLWKKYGRQKSFRPTGKNVLGT